MAKEIEDILKNDAINTALKTLSEKLGTTIDSLVDEFIRYYIGTHLFWLVVGILFVIIMSIVAYRYGKRLYKDDNYIDTDDEDALGVVLFISIVVDFISIIIFLYNAYCLVAVYCSPTITLIKYLHDMM